MAKAAPLAFGAVSILHAVADGNRFGFDIMDATGLTSGTVYPALEKLESLGYLTSAWESARARGATSVRPRFRPDRRRRRRWPRNDPLQEPQADPSPGWRLGRKSGLRKLKLEM
jgi:hypothetical protein